MPHAEVLIAALALTACAAGPDEPKRSAAEAAQLGTVSASLTLPDGTVLNTLQYTVQGGPRDINETHTVDVSQSNVVKFRIGDLPIGPGYTLSMAATTGDGVPCAGGSASFAVPADLLTQVAMQLVCRRVIDAEDDGGELGDAGLSDAGVRADRSAEAGQVSTISALREPLPRVDGTTIWSPPWFRRSAYLPPSPCSRARSPQTPAF